MEKKDVSIKVAGDILSVSGEMKEETEEEDGGSYWCERSYGSFGRTVRLPSEVDPDKVTASMKDGVLEISLPKTTVEKPEETTIKVM